MAISGHQRFRPHRARGPLRCMVERGSNSYQICGINLCSADLTI